MKYTILLALLIGCGETASDSSDASCTTLTYESFAQPFVSEYCTSCHGTDVTGSARMAAPVDEVFDTHAQVRAAADDIKLEVVTMRTMPPSTASAQPSSDERAMLGEWLDCGAP